MSSPMYSTGIGIVIETIARMEHDEYLEASKAAEKQRGGRQEQAESINIEPELNEVNDDKEEASDKKPRKKGIDLKKIVTSFTEFFTPEDNIE